MKTLWCNANTNERTKIPALGVYIFWKLLFVERARTRTHSQRSWTVEWKQITHKTHFALDDHIFCITAARSRCDFGGFQWPKVPPKYLMCVNVNAFGLNYYVWDRFVHVRLVFFFCAAFRLKSGEAFSHAIYTPELCVYRILSRGQYGISFTVCPPLYLCPSVLFLVFFVWLFCFVWFRLHNTHQMNNANGESLSPPPPPPQSSRHCTSCSSRFMRWFFLVVVVIVVEMAINSNKNV